MRAALWGTLVVRIGVGAGCGASDDRGAGRWAGTIDTLASGHVVVANPADPVWAPGDAWRVVEELRIGRAAGEGPDLFGDIDALQVDHGGRIWALDGQAQQLRIFDSIGTPIRTVGRRGGGPGEFAQVVRVDVGPDGNLWVMDPQNDRISVFDTAGRYLEGKRVLGGFLIFPWPGRFDELGRYYSPVPDVARGLKLSLVRYDTALVPIDTLDALPRDPVERETFEIRNDRGNVIAAARLPFQGRLTWRLSPAGTLWALITDQYRLFELDAEGDTLRTITREFTPLPVTDADLEQAREDLEWFTSQGGKVDWSKIPDTQPVAERFFFDGERDIWVEVATAAGAAGRVFDVFDPEGRYLGVVTLPFALARSPDPIFRDSVLYGVTRDELDVPYVVKARITKP